MFKSTGEAMKSYSSYLCYCLLLLSACSTAKFVPSDPVLAAQMKSRPAIYYSTEDVPFPYAEVGRIFVTDSFVRNRDLADRLALLRRKALEIGADAIIVEKNLSSGYIMGKLEMMPDLQGIAILKK